MNIKGNEKQYYDKIVVLYNKYGENIPDADLMHLSVIEKELGISFKRSQEIFELVKNQANSDKAGACISATVEKTEEKANTVAVAENKENLSESRNVMEASEIHSTSIKNESKIQKKETIVTTVVDNKPAEETTTANVETSAKNSELQIKEKSLQPVNAKQGMVDAENKDLIPVDDPGDINKWKVIFWYTIGFLTIILWGIGLIGSPEKTCGLCVDFCQSEQEKLSIYDATQQSPELFHFCIKGFSRCICRPIDKVVKDFILSVIHSCRYIIEGFIPKFSYFAIP